MPRDETHNSTCPGTLIDCLGVSVRRLHWEDFRSWVTAALDSSGRTTCIAIANAHSLNLAWSDQSYRATLNSFDLVLNDGVGLELYSILRGARFAYNFNGTDLWVRFFRDAALAGRSISVYLYGGRPGRSDAAGEQLERRYSSVRIVGSLDGYSSRDQDVVADIARTQPDLLLVGLGNPLQERWIERRRPHLKAHVACGVGALFDFLSGAVPRAPRWMQRSRLEWVYRLKQEPSRLFERYVVGNPLFLARSALYLASGGGWGSPGAR